MLCSTYEFFKLVLEKIRDGLLLFHIKNVKKRLFFLREFWSKNLKELSNAKTLVLLLLSSFDFTKKAKSDSFFDFLSEIGQSGTECHKNVR